MKQVAIVHYNTPRLTEATILSLRKHGGEEWPVTIFDNSDRLPFTAKMKGVTVVDNTRGQIIDFDKELAKFPDRNPRIGCAQGCVFGSVKHMMSIQALWDILPDGFLLMDSDILLKKDVGSMFRADRLTVGHIQTKAKSNNPAGVERLVPMLCYINVPLCRKAGIEYFDEKRSWGLAGMDRNDRNNWYDTGASFLEDVRNSPMKGLRIDIRPLMEHFKSGSWKNGAEQKAEVWLKTHANLWKGDEEKWYEPQVQEEAQPATPPKKKSKPRTRKRRNKKDED